MRELCNEPYSRAPGAHPLRCHYIKDHPGERHSWDVVKQQDDCDRVTPQDVQSAETIIRRIAAGDFDPYLEAILAAGHGRKRSLRGVSIPYGRP